MLAQACIIRKCLAFARAFPDFSALLRKGDLHARLIGPALAAGNPGLKFISIIQAVNNIQLLDTFVRKQLVSSLINRIICGTFPYKAL